LEAVEKSVPNGRVIIKIVNVSGLHCAGETLAGC